MFIGVEFVESRTGKTPAKSLVNRLINRAFANGLLLLPCGASTVRLMPPLLLTREQADEGLAILEASIRETAEG